MSARSSPLPHHPIIESHTTYPSIYPCARPSARPRARKAFAAARRAFARADAAFCDAVARAMAVFTPLAFAQTDALFRKRLQDYDRYHHGPLQALRRRTMRAWDKARAALRCAEADARDERAHRELMNDPLARKAVAAELGGVRGADAMLASWESRDRSHRAHVRELASIAREEGFAHPDAALAELRRRVTERQPMPRRLPPRIRAELAGEPLPHRKPRIVHPDVAWRLVAGGYGPRRTLDGRFAMAPVPRLVSVQRGALPPRPLEIDVRHAVSVEEVREQHVRDRAEERARRKADPKGYLDPHGRAPVLLTADELRRGWAAGCVKRPKGEVRDRRTARTRCADTDFIYPNPNETCRAVGHDPPALMAIHGRWADG